MISHLNLKNRKSYEVKLKEVQKASGFNEMSFKRHYLIQLLGDSG
jgi:hypothetical protein